MAQEQIDSLLNRVDSRYRLSMVVSRRAAQIKKGFPDLLDASEVPNARNSVSVALKEMVLDREVRWGNDLPTTHELGKVVERERPDNQEDYSVSVAEGSKK